VNHLLTIGWSVIRLNSGRMKSVAFYQTHPNNLTAGMPDLIAMTKGRTMWLEIKNATGRVSEAQRKAHKWLAYYGQEVYVIRSLEELTEVL
jgi:hypothetical protein